MNNRILIFSFLLLSITFFTSCLEDECVENREFFQYQPVRMTLAEMRQDIEVFPSFALKEPGKMYYYKNMLFINERGKGVHIYNNEDPSNPVYLHFYRIHANFDIAIKDDIMYADNGIDIISLDISDLANPVITKRIENFKQAYLPAGDNSPIYLYSIALPTKAVFNCSDSNFNENEFWRGDVLFSNTFKGGAVDLGSNSSGGSTQGVGGSTARFTLVENYLYAVSDRNLISIDISTKNMPNLVSRNGMGGGIETIFPYKNNLFIGSTGGMYIYGLDNPAYPNQITEFSHARACDPVVVQGDYAYVTLRSGSACQGFSNQLEIIDISNISSPELVKIYPMKNPNGLSINGDIMYLCESDYGLKILDVSDKLNVKELTFNEDIKVSDVIYLGDAHLLAIGNDGFYQYDVTDPTDIKLISQILKVK